MSAFVELTPTRNGYGSVDRVAVFVEVDGSTREFTIPMSQLRSHAMSVMMGKKVRMEAPDGSA